MKKKPFKAPKGGAAARKPSRKAADHKPTGRTAARPLKKNDVKKTSRPQPTRQPPKAREKKAQPVLHGTLLWGAHAVAQAWMNPKRKCLSLRATEGGLAALRESLDDARDKGLARPTPLPVTREDIDALTPRGAVHQGILLEVAPLPEISLDDLLGQDPAPRLVVILDQVTDPHNVGAVLRSAAAFGADAVIVTERHAPAMTGVLAKTASGALEHVPLVSVVNLARAIKALQTESFWCIGLAEEGSKDLGDCALTDGKIALLMGAEGEGLRRLTREHCDELARLPTQGAIGSLNVSNAAAVALYEARRQRR